MEKPPGSFVPVSEASGAPLLKGYSVRTFGIGCAEATSEAGLVEVESTAMVSVVEYALCDETSVATGKGLSL